MIRSFVIKLLDHKRRTQFLCVAIVCLLFVASESIQAEDVLTGLVGSWDFNDGTGKELSGNGNDAILKDARIHSLGKGRACLKVVPDTEPMQVPTSPDSPLAISRGTVCLWLNAACVDSSTILAYDNDAIQFRYYRRHFQPRFRGEEQFRGKDFTTPAVAENKLYVRTTGYLYALGE